MLIGYENVSAELKRLMRDGKTAISAHRDADSNSQRFTGLVKKYLKVEALDAVMLNGTAEKVVIHERDVSKGERRRNG